MKKANALSIVPVITWSADLKASSKVFYVYENTSKGHLYQKHGSDNAGTPFKSIEEASSWVSKKMKTGEFVFNPPNYYDF